jgi:arylsulfatase A-like enzyme
MIYRHAVVWVTLATLGACGKSVDNKQSANEPTPPANGTTTKPVPPQKAPQRGPEHAVYSLVDNRLSAHLVRGGGLVVPAGSAGFAKYTRLGNLMKGWKRQWELRQSEGEIKVAKIVGKTAAIHVPLTALETSRDTIRVRAFAPADGKLSVRVNDHKDLTAKIASGWSTVELAVPSGQLVDGENAIALFAQKSGLEIAWLQIGGKSAPPDDAAPRFYDANGKYLVVPKGAAMSWYVAVPDGGKLRADLDDGNCQLAVTATGDDGTTVDGKIIGTGAAVDLGTLASKAARIDLVATGTCDEAHVSNAALVVPGDAKPAPARGAAPKYVVFVIMDALRADRVRAFNPKARAEAPNFEKLAESSAIFDNAYVQGNESQVSHASIWSSNYLAKHKAMEMKDHLSEKWTTIDAVAKAGGLYVVGASGNGYIRPGRGFGQKWNQFVNHIEKGLGLKAADIIEKGLSFVSAKKDRPWFVYMGLIDTHVTWRAKQPWLDKYDGGYKGRFSVEYGDDGPNGSDGKDLTEKERDHVRALYDSNVSYLDDQMGKLVDKLQGWGIWDQTMLVITADHGDELWEDGRVGHGGSERETLLHVPLLVRYPPQFPAGHVKEGVDTIDIVPTIADALGVAQDPEWQGASLLPLANGVGAGYPLMSFSSQYESVHAGRIGRWKLKLMGTGAPRLYDLGKDPDERKDLYGSAAGAVAQRMLMDPMLLLRNWNVEWKKTQWGNAAAASNRFASDLGE